MMRSRVRRSILQKRLCCNRLELILDNKMIPKHNKEHYLYFSKVYEWRLNHPDLVGRFNQLIYTDEYLYNWMLPGIYSD